jgi:hypothetical protein
MKPGDRAEEKTLRTRKRKVSNVARQRTRRLRRSTHIWPGDGEVLGIKPGCSNDAVGTWEAVEERRW